MKETIQTSGAPAAIGPYSQAIKATGQTLLFISGQIPLDPATMQVVGKTSGEQCRRVLDNLGQVLKAAGADYSQVVKTTVYLLDLGDFGEVNEVYGTYFSAAPPARAIMQAARLPKDVKVEIDAIAVL
jgi:2-iminobutanoate/2-iminopropanoate deaminase